MSAPMETNTIAPVSKERTFPGNFWILRRMGGFSAELTRVEKIEHASLGDQLTAALLRRDQNRCLDLLKFGTGRPDEIAEVCRHANIAALLFERCCELKLENAMDEIMLADGMSLLSALKREAAVAISRFQRLDLVFTDLCDKLKQFGPDVLWLKGPVLARSVYEQPHFRLSEDFDIFVNWPARHAVIQHLETLGFHQLVEDAGHCHQFGIGPTNSIDDLSIAPGEEFEHCHNLTMLQAGSVMIELKFDPLEQGLRMLELDRFDSSCQRLSWNGMDFYAPDVIDHLLLELTHFHKHFFTGWQWLYDIHLLIAEIPKAPGGWGEFVRRCKAEKVNASAWAGLELSVDWLDSAVPASVLQELAPDPSLCRAFTFLAGSEFLWNTTSLPELLFDALFVGDRSRKLSALRDCILPSQRFLSAYYCRGGKVTWITYPAIWLVHMLVLILPGGIVRRTFGPWIWRRRSVG